MRSLVVILVTLTLYKIILAEVCDESIRTPYIKSTSSKIRRETTCQYKCWRRHETEVNTDYWAVDSCVIGYKTSKKSVCCEGYTGFGPCVPVCFGCINGRCTAPNVCSCNEGFRNQMGVCVPVCDPECGHGTCEAPGQCSCHEGYVVDPKKGCVPECDPPCQNGECVGLNTCECFSGFQQQPETNVCAPECNPQLADCGNGTCVGPNRCSCAEGFIFENNQCIPHCEPACINGECFEPNTCTCKEGYANDADNPNVCASVCNSVCRNGDCAAPNTCQCLPGYHQSNIVPNLCEPTCDPRYVDVRNGQCISLNVLRCNDGFVLEYSPLSRLMHCSLII